MGIVIPLAASTAAANARKNQEESVAKESYSVRVYCDEKCELKHKEDMIFVTTILVSLFTAVFVVFYLIERKFKNQP